MTRFSAFGWVIASILLCEQLACTQAAPPAQCDDIKVKWYNEEHQFSPATFDLGRNQCVIHMGALCDEEPDNCPTNAKCVKASDHPAMHFGYCRCLEGTISSEDDKFCGKPTNYNETCGTQDPTNPTICTEGMGCVDGRCRCGSEAYDEESGQCLSGLGARCKDYGANRIHCIPNAKCGHGGRCECSDGYEATGAARFCRPGFNKPCSNPDPCVESLECVDFTCVCPLPMHQSFTGRSWSRADECANLVGAKCRNGSSCVANAECNEGLGVCECEAGYAPTPERLCQLGRRGEGDQCSSAGSCDRLQGLACVNGTCRCFDPSLNFVKEQGGCVSEMEGHCGWISSVGLQVEQKKCEVWEQDGCNKYLVSCPHGYSCLSDPNNLWSCQQIQ